MRSRITLNNIGPFMPISPLHCGFLAPVNYFFANRVSNISFILVTLLIDYASITNVVTGANAPAHEWTNTFAGAGMLGVFIAVFGVRSWAWVLGAFYSVFTHVFLDSLVHSGMRPFYPIESNPLFMGWIDPLSLILIPFTIWFVQQNVSGYYSLIQRYLADRPSRNCWRNSIRLCA